jgi:hypothetical protein
MDNDYNSKFKCFDHFSYIIINHIHSFLVFFFKLLISFIIISLVFGVLLKLCFNSTIFQFHEARGG